MDDADARSCVCVAVQNKQPNRASGSVWMDFVFMGFGYMMWNPRYPNANVNGDFWVKRTTSTVSWSRR